MPGGTMPEAITAALSKPEIILREIKHFVRGC